MSYTTLDVKGLLGPTPGGFGLSLALAKVVPSMDVGTWVFTLGSGMATPHIANVTAATERVVSFKNLIEA